MSTRAERAIRQQVLDRDGWRCQRLVDGHPCGAPATDAGHLVARHHGGAYVPGNLQAECARHNRGDGDMIARTIRPTLRAWSW